MRDGDNDEWRQQPDEPWGEVHHWPTQRMEILRTELPPPSPAPLSPPSAPSASARRPAETPLVTAIYARYLALPTWTRVAAMVVLAVVVLGVLLMTTDGTQVPDEGAERPAPLALCGPRQREAIERANHPWQWYHERYDPDGNGVLCE